MSSITTEFSIKSIFQQAQSGELKMHSSLGTRDESKQTKEFITRIAKMSTVCGINARALVMKDIVLPFNPFTLKSDDTYNENNKYRPILLVSQVIEGIKELCREDPELAKGYENLLEGTFDDCKEATMNDYLLFKHKGFIFPRVMSYYVTQVNMAGKQGLPEFKVRYTVDERELNAEKNYDYDKAPVHAQLASLFNAICREEWKSVKTILDKNNVTDDEKTAKRTDIFSKSPISFVKPFNVLPFFFFPHDEKFPTIKEDNFMDIEKNIRFYNKTDKWITAFNEVQKEDELDELIDFYDFTIKTPESGTATSSGKVLTDDDANAVYQALTITVTDGRTSLVKSLTKGFVSAYNAIKNYFMNSQMEEVKEDGMSFEKIISLSTRCRPIDSISESILPAACEIFNEKFADSPYFTENIRKQFDNILCAMNPANALATAEYDAAELEEAGREAFTDMQQFMVEISDEQEEDIDLNMPYPTVSEDKISNPDVEDASADNNPIIIA